jgi:hypothetical protein
MPEFPMLWQEGGPEGERIRALFQVAGVKEVLITCGTLAEAQALLRGGAASAA